MYLISILSETFSTCKSGKWDCTDNKCPGTCIIYGSGHYITFDENSYGFHGQMSYTVVKVRHAFFIKNNCMLILL